MQVDVSGHYVYHYAMLIVNVNQQYTWQNLSLLAEALFA